MIVYGSHTVDASCIYRRFRCCFMIKVLSESIRIILLENGQLGAIRTILAFHRWGQRRTARASFSS